MPGLVCMYCNFFLSQLVYYGKDCIIYILNQSIEFVHITLYVLARDFIFQIVFHGKTKN